MAQFILRRMLGVVPLILLISFAVFIMMHLLPGDPVVAMLGETGSMGAEEIQQFREQLGLDKPLILQYTSYLQGLLRLDFGMSIQLRLPVRALIGQRLSSTLQLAFAGLALAVVLGVVLGAVSALNHNTWIDSIAVTIALLGVSIPSYWLGLMLISVFSVTLAWVPIAAVDGWQGLVLPAATLGFAAAAPVARFTRSGMLEVMSQDFVRTARSKGLAQSRVTLRHVLRNALIPVVTIAGIRFGSILAGTVIIESVFVRPGLGLLLLESIRTKDFLVVQGIILIVSVAFVLGNLLVEIIYTWLDPRIQYG
ncbi:MAG: ABC transporter permease [Deinococcota bacterium]